MRLQLTVRQTEARAGVRDAVHDFDRFPLTIGRSAECALVLHDESRFVSSRHAVLSQGGSALNIRDTSANGVFLNGSGEPLGHGNETALRDGDVIGIGDYALIVTLDVGSAGSGFSGESNAFAALDDVGASAAARMTADEALDPFFGSEGGAPDWPSDWPGDKDGKRSDAPPPASAHAAGAARTAQDAWPDDWPDHQAAAAASPPAPALPAARPRPAAVASPQPPGDPQLDALLLQCLDGLMALLRSRSQLKEAMRTDVTALHGTGNNPLKFSRDGREALARLLDPANGGEYLAAEVALAQAIDDLALHQVAMLEGMKGAVGALLARFDPDALSDRLTADHPLAATIPLARDAKLWQLFCAHFGDIERAAKGDFTAVFGKEFAKAYEARIRELGREPDLW